MIRVTTNHPLNGISVGINRGDYNLASRQPESTAPATEAVLNSFFRLVSVFQSNAYLASELKSVNTKLDQARAYLRAPGSHPVIASANHLRMKARHAAVLTLLRANRVEARALLGLGDSPA